MARVNISLPDGLLEQARAAGLNVSRLAAAALADELDRRTKVAALEAYLAELDAELGPVSQQDEDAALLWADTELPQASSRVGPSRRTRTA